MYLNYFMNIPKYSTYLSPFFLSFKDKVNTDKFEKFREEFRSITLFKVIIYMTFAYLIIKRVLSLADAIYLNSSYERIKKEIIWLTFTAGASILDTILMNISALKFLAGLIQPTCLYYIMFDNAVFNYHDVLPNDPVTSTGFIVDPVSTSLVSIILIKNWYLACVAFIPSVFITIFYTYYFFQLTIFKLIRIPMNMIMNLIILSIFCYCFELTLKLCFLLNKKLKKDGKSLAKILKFLPSGIAVMAKSTLKFINPIFLDILGYNTLGLNMNYLSFSDISKFCLENQQDIFKKFVDFFDNKNKKLIDYMLHETLKEDKNRQILIQKVVDNKTYTYDYKRERIMFNGVLSRLFILTNITASIDLEFEKQDKKSKSLAVASLTHDMRAPLTGMIGNIEHILETTTDVNIKSTVLMLKNNSRLLLSLINDALDIFQIAENKIQIHYNSFKVKSVCEDCISMLEINFGLKGISLKFHIKEDVPEYIVNDELRYARIIINLLSNALKFTSRGFVKLKVQYDFIDNILITSVKDTGIGISEEDQAKLFKPYTTLHNSFLINPTGAGLGLSVCSTLTNLMGGQVSVKSKQGRGSKFTFTIKNEYLRNINSPSENPNNNNHSREVIDTESDLINPEVEDSKINVIEPIIVNVEKKESKLESKQIHDKLPRLLICDDDPQILYIYTIYLKNYKISIEKAFDGLQAVELFKESILNPFDIIFLDSNMPQMNGIAALNEMRNASIELKINLPPIIIVSGEDFSENDKSMLTSNGACQIILKPMKKEKLLEILKNYKII